MSKTVEIQCPHCGHKFYAKANAGLVERLGKTIGGGLIGLVVAGPIGGALGTFGGSLASPGGTVDCPNCGGEVERADIK